MSPIRHERSVVHPRWLRVRWGWMAVAAFVMLCSASAFGSSWLGICWALFVAWLLWRGDRDGGPN